MKKTLLIIINFVLCVISLPAQILYSVTPEGGKYGYGTIGKFLPATNELTVVKSFGPVESEGVKPSGTLVVATDVKLYGMTTNGGSSGVGVIFSFDPNSSTLTKLKDFNDADGARPNGSLIKASDGKLYGMTTNGGSGEAGVIFSFDPSTSTYARLHKFDWYNEGGNPSGSLVQASDGKLYGMTPNGGSSRAGVIFSFDPSTFTYAKLYDFDYYAGGNPSGNLIQASDGKLYGMTANGGSNGAGAIFSFDPVSSTLKKLKDFEQTTGGSYGSLVQASDGKLYGTTRSNGQSGNPDVIPGVIFSFDPSTSIYTKLYDFDPYNDGGGSFGSLMQASDGKLYGMTTAGEPHGGGVIFSFDPSISRYTKLIDYTATNGAYAGLGSAFIELKECIVADSTWYKDGDGDGYGNPAYRVKACPRPAGYVADNTDCNDNNKAVHAPITYYLDSDGDGFGDPFQSINICSDTLPAGYVRNNYDCHDNEGASDPGLVMIRMCTGEWTQCVYVKDTAEKLSQGWTIGVCPLQSCGPDETLMCNNGKQECVKSTDVAAKLAEAGGKWSLGPYCGGAHISTCNEKDTTYYRDYDGDGFGDPDHPISVSACTHPVGYVVNNADCNDSNKLVHAVTWYRDFDGDGFGDPAHPINASACTPPAGYVTNYSDCNDSNIAVHGKVTYYRDFDGDGFGDPDQFTTACSDTPPAGYVKNNYDCNDLEGASQPGNVRIQMCHDGSAECVYVKDTAEKLSQGWTLGLCSPILYSMTTGGGKYGYGTINKFLPATNELIVVKSFGPAESDGVTPAGTPVEAINGKLYGMTTYGGTYGFGTIFSFDPATSIYTKLKDFDNVAGGYPKGGSLVQASDGKLYGMTFGAWYAGNGVLFSFDPSSLSYKVLKDFDANSGAHPVGSLIQASDGKLYGMTSDGVEYDWGWGALFSFDPFSGTYTKLQDFDKVGGQPQGSLVQASDGKLYSTNLAGIQDAPDNIFSFDIITSTYKNLFGLWAGPTGSLIQVRNGKLFGMTAYGGDDNSGYHYGNGTIFYFDIVTHEFKELRLFDTTNGLHPWGPLMQASDGKLYGLTHEGGSSNTGIIFRYVPSANKLTKLIDFNGTNGAYPEDGIIEVADCAARSVYYKDNDGDGFGNPYNWKLACSQPEGYVTNNTDCNDYNKAVTCCQPGISAPVTYYHDFDQDGFGDPNHPLTDSLCKQPAGYVADNTDCNDSNKAVHAPFTYYRDYDRDGFGDPYHPANFCSDTPPAGYVRNNYDCYDLEGGNQPGQARVRMCHDGWTQCVYAKDTAEKLSLGWTLGVCPLQSCAGDETLMCHNGKQECVKTTNVAAKLAEPGGKWSLGPFCSGVPISGSGSNGVRKTDMARTKESTPSLPAQYSLSNHPNPFTGTSTIKYELPLDSKVSIKVYDLAGRIVATLVDEYKKAGTYTINFNASNLSSGSLFYKIIAISKEGQFERTNQMVKIK